MMLKIVTLIRPGLAIGSMTWKNSRVCEQPSIIPASATDDRQRLEERGQEEDGERQRVGDVDQHQAGVGVQQTQVLHHEEERHQGQEDREGQPRDEQEVDRPVARELVAGQHVGGHRAEQHGAERAARHHDHAVEEVAGRRAPWSRPGRSSPSRSSAGSVHGLLKISRGVLERGEEGPEDRHDHDHRPDGERDVRQAGE